jgi:haloacetate dehalogenase
MFDNFQKQIIETQNTTINLVKGGQGFPLLLLHGYPQTHVMWHKIAPLLAKDFTVIATDLRGYGDSFKPQGETNHSNYSKRIVAQDQVEIMTQLGYEQFYLIGHDRGGRVAHRLTLDYPEKVKKLAVLDIVPTLEMYQKTDREFATGYYHWFFLIQPYPFPETLISNNSEYFLNHCLKSWSRDFSAFTPEALKEYDRCFSDPKMIHGTCEDYRASATIDLEHDREDFNQKIQCPLLVLWGSQGLIARKYQVKEIWQQKAIKVEGFSVKSGHFLAEEAPQETYQYLKQFLDQE